MFIYIYISIYIYKVINKCPIHRNCGWARYRSPSIWNRRRLGIFPVAAPPVATPCHRWTTGRTFWRRRRHRAQGMERWTKELPGALSGSRILSPQMLKHVAVQKTGFEFQKDVNRWLVLSRHFDIPWCNTWDDCSPTREGFYWLWLNALCQCWVLVVYVWSEVGQTSLARRYIVLQPCLRLFEPPLWQDQLELASCLRMV